MDDWTASATAAAVPPTAASYRAQSMTLTRPAPSWMSSDSDASVTNRACQRRSARSNLPAPLGRPAEARPRTSRFPASRAARSAWKTQPPSTRRCRQSAALQSSGAFDLPAAERRGLRQREQLRQAGLRVLQAEGFTDPRRRATAGGRYCCRRRDRRRGRSGSGLCKSAARRPCLFSIICISSTMLGYGARLEFAYPHLDRVCLTPKRRGGIIAPQQRLEVVVFGVGRCRQRYCGPGDHATCGGAVCTFTT
jgi:hypothetical protein